MKLPPDTARKLVFEALFKHDGDREKAAHELGVARRTFDRWIKTLNLYDQIDMMGWKRPGPPRGMPRGSSVIRARIVAYIRKHRGVVDYGKLAIEIYGEDSRTTRQNIYTALDDLKNQGVVTHDDRTGHFHVEVEDVSGRR